MYLAECAFGKERTLDFIGLQVLITFKDKVAHLHLGFLVDVDIQDNLILARDVVALHNFNFGILVAFGVEIFLSQNLGAVNHVRRYLRVLHDAELGLHVLALRLLQADIVDFADARPQGQMYAEVYLRAYNGVGRNLHTREESVTPVALHGLGNLLSGNLYLLPH